MPKYLIPIDKAKALAKNKYVREWTIIADRKQVLVTTTRKIEELEEYQVS